MVMRVAWLLLAASAIICAEGSPSCEVERVSVDFHAFRSALDAGRNPLFGWVIGSGCVGAQTSYQIMVRDTSGSTAWDSGEVKSNASANVRCDSKLEQGTRYDVTVNVAFEQGSATSSPTSFLTLLDSKLETAAPMWSSDASAIYVLFRRDLPPAGTAETYLSISAKPLSDTKLPHGVNSSHILCSYKLWVNGVPLGVGPGRKVGGAISVDTYNLTELVSSGESVIAIQAYNDIGVGEGGVLALIHDGKGTFLGGNAGAWTTYDATAAFCQQRGNCGSIGTGGWYYPIEHIDAKAYPQGWRTGGGFPSSQWTPAVATKPWADGVIARQALPVSMRDVEPERYIVLGDGHYIVDFGRDFQGGINMTFPASTDARKVTVRFGEQLNFTCTGSGASDCVITGIIPLTTDGHRWESQWALSGSAGERFVNHEYLEFRYVEFVGAPDEPVPISDVHGWAARYPFDTNLNERTTQPRDLTETLFEADDDVLQAVWGLVNWTIAASVLDLNTDSNTRQRDVCTLDAFLQTVYQGAVFPTTAYHNRRRVVQYMWEPLGYVNYWTEFLTSTLSGLYQFTWDYADTRLAERVWDSQTPSHKHCPPGNFSRRNYTLDSYFDSKRSLVAGTPRPLVDYPRTPLMDTDIPNVGVCNNVCVQMNSHAVTVQAQAAALSSWLGRTDDSASYAKRSAAIRSAANTAFSAKPDECNPATSGTCYADTAAAANNSAKARPTTSTASAMAADARLCGSAKCTLDLVPFLRARNTRRGEAHGMELSGWMSFFMLRGLYSAAGEVDEGEIPLDAAADAAEYAHSVLVNRGMNSWYGGMIGIQNATMTTESWIVEFIPGYTPEGGSTMSHPWTAAPAALIPRYLMGVRPLAQGWETLTVRPIPSGNLTRASIQVPTPRGTVKLSFVQSGAGTQAWAWDANVTVPGNTRAQVCAPRYLAPEAANCKVTPRAVRRGALVCLENVIVGGSLRMQVVCN